MWQMMDNPGSRDGQVSKGREGAGHRPRHGVGWMDSEENQLEGRGSGATEQRLRQQAGGKLECQRWYGQRWEEGLGDDSGTSSHHGAQEAKPCYTVAFQLCEIDFYDKGKRENTNHSLWRFGSVHLTLSP